MSNQAGLQENWDTIKEKLRNKWRELTDDDLDASKDNFQHLVDTIQRKTGEASENVENFFGQILSSGNSAFYQVGESIREGAKNANASIRRTYDEMESAVRHRPASSIAIGLAVGVLTGLTLSMLLRRK
jgi:ElaB/YqjD/DUF883 family membrane-anchored ribosome-binding protein